MSHVSVLSVIFARNQFRLIVGHNDYNQVFGTHDHNVGQYGLNGLLGMSNAFSGSIYLFIVILNDVIIYGCRYV